MNVLLLGEIGDQLDEGMKNTSLKLSEALGAEGHSVTLFDLPSVTSLAFWRELRDVEADIVHLIPGPTPQGLTLLQLIGTWKDARTVATATQPLQTDTMKRLSAVLAPDRLLVQSTTLQQEFESANFATEFVPSGVDTAQFSPADNQEPLREKLDLPTDERLFLHVGHCKEGRNVRALTHLNEFGTVVVVGSPSTGPEQELIDDLRDEGVIVRTDYVKQIEEYYNAADVYVFPVTDTTNSIQVPLSVFEAMGCNCPVVATRFGGLTDCFSAGDGLRYVDDIGNVTEADLEFERVDTRSKVETYSWAGIGRQVSDIYGEL